LVPEIHQLSDEIKRFVISRLNARWILFQDPIHTTSYFLDPRFRSAPVSELDRRNGVKEVKKLLPPSQNNWVEVELTKLRSKEFPYDEIVQVDNDPLVYWKNLAGTSEGKLWQTWLCLFYGSLKHQHL